MDEWGSIAGIASLEDVLEEILGREIVDEFDENVDLQEHARRKSKALAFLKAHERISRKNMIHEITPRVMHNEFRSQFPLATDYLFYFEGENVLLCKNGDSCTLPTFEKIAADNEGLFPLAHYLFSIDETAFFLTEKKSLWH